MSAVGVRTCPVCGEEFEPNHFGGNQQFCSPECGKTAYRRGETAAIVPSETKPVRTSKMTDDEFDAWYLRFRTELDHRPYHPGDLWWRRAQIKRKVADGWTIAQMARWFRVTPKQMRELVKAAKQERRAA